MQDVSCFLVLSNRGDGEDCVIKARGSIDVHNAARFQDTVLDALIAGPARILVDLACVDHLDEIAADVLARARRRAYELGTTVIIKAANPAIMPVLQKHGFYASWTKR